MSGQTMSTPTGQQLEAVELLLTTEGKRQGEPVTCGVPWPRGWLKDPVSLLLEDEHGQNVPVQSRVLSRWPDGSARWVLLDWQASANRRAVYRLRQGSAQPSVVHSVSARVAEQHATVDTGTAQFQIDFGPSFPFDSVSVHNKKVLEGGRSGFLVEDNEGQLYRSRMQRCWVEDAGPLRVQVCVVGDLVSADGKRLAEFSAQLHFFAGSSTVRLLWTLRNTRAAEHPGGLWDLGNGGSIYVRDAALTLVCATPASSVLCSPGVGEPLAGKTFDLELYQDSSGGANWQSSNHLTRERKIPTQFPGYRLRHGSSVEEGKRATPILLSQGDTTVGAAVPWFWQNFPQALEVRPDQVVLRFLPRQFSDVHEIQGGEQKTWEAYLAFAPDSVSDTMLEWCRAPMIPHAAPQWYSKTGVVPGLTPRQSDPNSEYLALVDSALEGADTFEMKRELIDEYGWRHFGEIYGDHEAVFHKGPQPLVSHYNNQYDPVGGFAIQFMRSGDLRWFNHMNELARHVVDIDIYHTSEDKSAYNKGLFWHTVHYVDADTGTHRSYPKAARVCGGGPGNEQNYAMGLELHYYLTGNPASKEAAIGLARWVIDMDDGRKTVFRWLAGGDTGLASASRTPDYQGPGRGSANSLAALIDGHRLTGDAQFLRKAEQIILRVIHPDDNVPARDLLDAENRWFYTMFLQSLGKYLLYKVELDQVDEAYAYARASLLHYARWMADNEYPYLEKPEILEYPTETWAAQDMRKCEIFDLATLFAEGPEKARFRERAEFFFRYSSTALSQMPTRTLARPVVLLLSNGFRHAWYQAHPDACAPRPRSGLDNFGKPTQFVPQKARAMARAKVIAVAGLVGAFLVASLGLYLLLR